MGNQRVTVLPKEWKRGKHPRMVESLGRASWRPNWQTFARRFRWLRGTPLGFPEEPEVKRRRASSSPLDFPRPRSLMRRLEGRMRPRRAHLTMLFLMRGRMRSTKRSSRLGGQGKLAILRTKGSAVM